MKRVLFFVLFQCDASKVRGLHSRSAGSATPAPGAIERDKVSAVFMRPLSRNQPEENARRAPFEFSQGFPFDEPSRFAPSRAKTRIVSKTRPMICMRSPGPLLAEMKPLTHFFASWRHTKIFKKRSPASGTGTWKERASPPSLKLPIFLYANTYRFGSMETRHDLVRERRPIESVDSGLTRNEVRVRDTRAGRENIQKTTLSSLSLSFLVRSSLSLFFNLSPALSLAALYLL